MAAAHYALLATPQVQGELMGPPLLQWLAGLSQSPGPWKWTPFPWVVAQISVRMAFAIA